MSPLGAERRDPSLPRAARRLISRIQPHDPGPPPGLSPRASRRVPSNLGRDPRRIPSDLGPDPPGEVGEVVRHLLWVCRPRTDETRWRWAPGEGAESVVPLS